MGDPGRQWRGPRENLAGYYSEKKEAENRQKLADSEATDEYSFHLMLSLSLKGRR